jgi:hypothetical protein
MWPVYLSGTLIFIAFVSAVAWGWYKLHRWERERLERLAATRPGDPWEQFRSHFAGESVSEDVVSAVYKHFQDWCGNCFKAFPVRAEDDIFGVYQLGPDDLEDDVMELVKVCGRRLPPRKALENMKPLVTVEDIVWFIATCPERRVRR